MSNVITATLVRTAGRVDTAATMSQFNNDLAVFVAKEEEDMEVIGGAVSAVWDAHPESNTIGLETLTDLALRNLKVGPEDFAEVKESIKDYVRGATDLFAIVKGKGGVRRLDRLSAEELATVMGQREKAAAKKAA